MNFFRSYISDITAKGSDPRRSRQLKAAGPVVLASVLLLAGCQSLSQIGDDFMELGKGLGQLDDAEDSLGFLGGLAADEPNAVLAGRDVLKAGGNAVDAATAVYFSLAVTMPSSASLGGGGVCVVHDAQTNETRVLDFLSKTPRSADAARRRGNAVGGNLPGFKALHGRYGRLPWAQLVAPAEGLARFGFKTSRAFSRDLQQIGDALLADPAARNIFGRPVAGGLLREGDKWLQPDLADVLGGIRENGSTALYRQPGAGKFAAAYNAGGGAMSVADLIEYKPIWRNTIEVPLGDISVHFAPPPAAGGAVAAQMLAMMLDRQRFSETPPDQRPHLQVEAAIRAYADRGLWLRPDGSSSIDPADLVSMARISPLMSSYRRDSHIPAAALDPAPVERPENPSATGFAVMDGDGAAVACGLTMNGLFGNGLIARGTGVLMAAAPGRGRGPVSLGPMLAVDHFSGDFFFAGAASGGVTAPTALMSVAMATAVNVERLEDAMLARRLHASGTPDIVYYEQGYDEAAIETLIGKGHRVAATPSLGRVNAVGCIQGFPFDPDSCEAATDPRGFGLAIKIDD